MYSGDVVVGGEGGLGGGEGVGDGVAGVRRGGVVVAR